VKSIACDKLLVVTVEATVTVKVKYCEALYGPFAVIEMAEELREVEFSFHVTPVTGVDGSPAVNEKLPLEVFASVTL